MKHPRPSSPFVSHQPYCRRQHGNTAMGFILGIIATTVVLCTLWYFEPTPEPTINVRREVQPNVDFRDNAVLPLPEPTPTPKPATLA